MFSESRSLSTTLFMDGFSQNLQSTNGNFKQHPNSYEMSPKKPMWVYEYPETNTSILRRKQSLKRNVYMAKQRVYQREKNLTPQDISIVIQQQPLSANIQKLLKPVKRQTKERRVIPSHFDMDVKSLQQAKTPVITKQFKQQSAIPSQRDANQLHIYEQQSNERLRKRAAGRQPPQSIDNVKSRYLDSYLKKQTALSNTRLPIKQRGYRSRSVVKKPQKSIDKPAPVSPIQNNFVQRVTPQDVLEIRTQDNNQILPTDEHTPQTLDFDHQPNRQRSWSVSLRKQVSDGISNFVDTIKRKK